MEIGGMKWAAVPGDRGAWRRPWRPAERIRRSATWPSSRSSSWWGRRRRLSGRRRASPGKATPRGRRRFAAAPSVPAAAPFVQGPPSTPGHKFHILNHLFVLMN